MPVNNTAVVAARPANHSEGTQNDCDNTSFIFRRSTAEFWIDTMMLHWINFGKARYTENIDSGHITVLLYKVAYIQLHSQRTVRSSG